MRKFLGGVAGGPGWPPTHPRPLRVLAGAGALLLGGFLAPASAAPGLPSGLKPTATENSAVEQVHYRYRRCWRHHGHLHCRRVARRYYGAPITATARSPAWLVLRRSPALGSPALAALVNNTSEAGLAGLIRIAACCDTAAPLYSSTSRCRSLLRGTQTAGDKALHLCLGFRWPLGASQQL